MNVLMFFTQNKCMFVCVKTMFMYGVQFNRLKDNCNEWN